MRRWLSRHLSWLPCRFAGGKSWLTGRLRWWLLSTDGPTRLLAEPFADGASVSLAAVGLGLTPKVSLVERDDDTPVRLSPRAAR